MVGVLTFPTSDRGERRRYSSGLSQGGEANQYRAKKFGVSEVRTKLLQLMTGLAETAARKRSVLPTIQAVRTPPPLPPVTKRFPGSTKPRAIVASTRLIRSS